MGSSVWPRAYTHSRKSLPLGREKKFNCCCIAALQLGFPAQINKVFFQQTRLHTWLYIQISFHLSWKKTHLFASPVAFAYWIPVNFGSINIPWAGRRRIHLHVKCQRGQLITMCLNRCQGGFAVANAPAGHLSMLSPSIMHEYECSVACTYRCKRQAHITFTVSVEKPAQTWIPEIFSNSQLFDCFLHAVDLMVSQ